MGVLISFYLRVRLENNKIYILWSTKELINHKSPSCSSDSQWFGTAPLVAVFCQPQSWTTPEDTEGIMSWMKPCSFYRHVIQCNLKGSCADKLSLNSWRMKANYFRSLFWEKVITVEEEEGHHAGVNFVVKQPLSPARSRLTHTSKRVKAESTV